MNFLAEAMKYFGIWYMPVWLLPYAPVGRWDIVAGNPPFLGGDMTATPIGTLTTRELLAFATLQYIRETGPELSERDYQDIVAVFLGAIDNTLASIAAKAKPLPKSAQRHAGKRLPFLGG